MKDRHGRGLRGPLYPASMPRYRSRHVRFGELMSEAVDRLAAVVGSPVAMAEFHYTMIPGRLEDRLELVRTAGAAGAGEVMASVSGADLADAALRVTVHRMPIEARAHQQTDDGGAENNDDAIEELIYRVLVRCWAEISGLAVDDIDPSASP